MNTNLEALRTKGAMLRMRREAAKSDRLFNTKEWNLCALSNRIFDGSHFQEGHTPLFRTTALNFCVISKEVVPRTAQIQLRPYQLATKVFFPYDIPQAIADKPAGDGQSIAGRSFYVGQKHYKSILRQYFMGGMDVQSQEADMTILDTLNGIPSLDPFMIKDRFETDRIDIDPNYLLIDDERWAAMKDRIIDDFTPIAEKAFGNIRELRQKTSILVQKLWEATDLGALMPLTLALKIREEKAHEVYYAWKGILFYKTQYQEAIERMEEFFTFISRHQNEFSEIVGPGMVYDWGKVIKRIKIMVGEIRFIMDEYEKLRNDFSAEGKRVGDFIEFFRMAPDFFWLIGGNLACFEHCLKLVHEFQKNSIPTPDTIDDLYRSVLAVAIYAER